MELEEFIMTLGGKEQLELDENELSRGITNLINAANYGITMASKKYDETKAYPFFSYAQWWVMNSSQKYASTTIGVRLMSYFNILP